VQAERVAGEMEERTRQTCSRVWWVHKIWQQRDGGDDGGCNEWAACAVLKMACPSDYCGQPPQRTPHR